MNTVRDAGRPSTPDVSGDDAFSIGSDIDLAFEEDDGPVLGSPANKALEETTEKKNTRGEQKYTCVRMEDVEQTAKFLIDETTEIIGIDPDTIEYLLRCYQWQSSNLVQDWIDSSEKVLSKTNISIGVVSDTIWDTLDPMTSFLCPITADEVPLQETDALSCGHRVSKDCWRQYLETAVKDEGAEISLSKKCPIFKCGRIIPERMWKTYLSPPLYEKYRGFRRRALVSSNPLFRWCPAKYCERIIKRMNITDNSPEDATCGCGKTFCMMCADEPHSPIPCDIVRKWHLKNRSEADNMTWVFVHTKCCPSCRNPIEKNQGCMHMTCRCGHQFCWLCMGKWSKHNTSSFYTCNVYSKTKPVDPMEETKEKARQSLEKYAHYFERYRAHNHGQQVAVQRQMRNVKSQITTLHDRFQFLTGTQFLEDAVLQIIECRRILKWSYAFGYFANWKGRPQAKILFEDHQGELEKNLDRLQEMSENFNPDVYTSEQYGEFLEFKMQLSNLTRVISGFFRRMTQAFKTEFIAVEMDLDTTTTTNNSVDDDR